MNNEQLVHSSCQLACFTCMYPLTFPGNIKTLSHTHIHVHIKRESKLLSLWYQGGIRSGPRRLGEGRE